MKVLINHEKDSFMQKSSHTWVSIIVAMMLIITVSGRMPIWAQAQTIEEAEPRTPISSLPYTITQSGSYYLTQDLTMTTDQHGITVNADDVTIDLKGFNLIGALQPNGIYNGIHIPGHWNVEIKNGTVQGWSGDGIYAGSPNSVAVEEEMEEYSGDSHRIINIRAELNASAGIWLDGFGHLVKDCTCSYNSLFGIKLGLDCTVTGNTLYENGSAIVVDARSTVTGNTCSLAFEGYSGIMVTDGCSVQGNTVSVYYQGIVVVGQGNLIKNNTVRNTSTGVLVQDAANAVEENLITASTTGIDFLSAGNFYANNRCAGCTTGFGGSVPTGQGDGGGNRFF